MRTLKRVSLICFGVAVAASLTLLAPDKTAAQRNWVVESSRATCNPQTGVPATRLATMARGFNLTGWLEGPSPRPPDERALAGLLRRGMTHIRLPVTPEKLSEAFSTRDQVAAQLKTLDYAIDRLIGLGFGVSLDVHPGDRIGRLHVADPERAFETLKTVWLTLARRY